MSLESVCRFGWSNPIDVEGYSPGHPVHEAAIAQKKMREAAVGFWTSLDRLKGNDELTPKGRTRRLKEIGKEALERLDKIEGLAPFRTPRQRLAKLEATMAVTVPPLDDAAAVLREQEIRGVIRSLDPSARLQAFVKALETGDEGTFLACVRAPKVAPIVPERVLEEGIQSWAERKDPRTAKEIKDLRQAVQAIEQNLGDLRREIGQRSRVTDATLRDRLEAGKKYMRRSDARGEQERAAERTLRGTPPKDKTVA